MGIPVMILGESGTGKSCSLRNFDSNQVGVINIARKPLPFRSKLKELKTDDPRTIISALKGMKTRSAVVDDFQYILADSFMKRSKEVGFQKFSDMAYDYWSIVQTVINDMPDDKIVYFLSHLQRDEYGNEKAKTIGKLLDEKITVEGMFTIVLKTAVQDGKYYFRTVNSGSDTVKAPMGMFATELIDNDLAAVDTVIREYYGIGGKQNG